MDLEYLAETSEGPRVREYLYRGIMKIEDPDRRLKAAFAFMATLLTLRRAAAAHLRELWIDWDLGTIETPLIDPCECIVCWREAHEQWLRGGFDALDADDYWDEGVTFEDLSRDRWPEIVEEADLEVDRLMEIVQEEQFSGKTDAWSRTIPFGMSSRAVAVFLAFFHEYDVWPHSAKQLHEYIQEGAENMPELNEEYVGAHNDRAGGITFFAKLYPEWVMVRNIAGHSDAKHTMDYIRDVSKLAVHQAYKAANREELSPGVIPENPEAAFPVLLDPTPREGEREMFEYVFGERLTPEEVGSKEVREQRAEQIASQEHELHNPREFNLPKNRKAFPAEEITRPEEFKLPGDKVIHIEETDRFTISGNRTLREFQQPHSLPPDDEVDPHPFHQPVDPQREDHDTFSAFDPVTSGLFLGETLTNDLLGKAKALLRSMPGKRMVLHRKTEVAQIIRGVANYVDPDHSASVNWHRFGSLLTVWLVLIVLVGSLLVGTGFYESPGMKTVLIGVLGIQVRQLPWDELDVADFLPVKKRDPTTTQSPFLNSERSPPSI